MAARADAHIHLFEGGYHDSFAGRPGVGIDEVACYASLAESHGISAALVVGYGAAPWCSTNTEYLARQAAAHEWVYPVAFIAADDPPTIGELEALRARGFVGLSFYVSRAQDLEGLGAISDDVWSWLVRANWLLSVNSRGPDWRAWQGILERHDTLRVVASHLGLPPRVSVPPTPDAARAALADVCNLARFPGPRVKLSGFYALSDPGHDYPHRAAWPYVDALLEAFGPQRLLWASDFSPCLDMVSFPQTLGVLSLIPSLGEAERQLIEGENLHGLLAQADRGR